MGFEVPAGGQSRFLAFLLPPSMALFGPPSPLSAILSQLRRCCRGIGNRVPRPLDQHGARHLVWSGPEPYLRANTPGIGISHPERSVGPFIRLPVTIGNTHQNHQ